jgi:coenzyme F420-0:L-glutamate ligase/coenzyme F420-1:gamma-L-glutamate ligase
MSIVQIIGIQGLPILQFGDDISEIICHYAEKQGVTIQDYDIIVVTHVIVSRVEGRIVNLNEVIPSEFAKMIAEQYDKDPALVEVVLRESKRIVRMDDGKLIMETKHGLVCANSGVDKSNVPGDRIVALLPEDPHHSAEAIRQGIRECTGCEVAVIISDTHGRPLREGEINIAIGFAGISPIRDRRGEKDLFGYTLKVKRTAIADELASAAELVMGQADEGIPVAIIRGYDYPKSDITNGKALIRSKENDLFL